MSAESIGSPRAASISVGGLLGPGEVDRRGLVGDPGPTPLLVDLARNRTATASTMGFSSLDRTL